MDTIPNTDVVINQKTIFTITTQVQGLVSSDNSFVYPQNPPDSEKLVILKEEVEKYEKKLAEKQDEIKTISREMLSKNHDVEDIQKFLYSNMIKDLHDIKKNDRGMGEFYMLADGRQTIFKEIHTTPTDRIFSIPFQNGTSKIMIIATELI